MYRNPRSKGFKTKNILQVCLLLAVCFWLLFQVKRSRDKNKEFDATRHDDDKLTTRIHRSEEIVKFGRKHLPGKVDDTVKEVEKHEQQQEEEEEEEVEEEEEEKIDEEKDDEVDENDEQQKSDIEIEREEVDIIDEDKENEEKEEESQNDTTVDNDVDEEHTHELREEHYKADDASSAVTHDGRLLGTENEIKNGTLVNSSENVGQENESGPMNPTSLIDFLENGPPSNTTVIEQVSNSTDVSENSGSNETNVETDEGESGNLETRDLIEGTDEVQHMEEKEVRTDLDTLPEIETEGGADSIFDTAAE